MLFPDAGLTKVDLAAYYADVAGVMLPHLRDRPLILHRFPDGIGGDGFFPRTMPRHFPDWIAPRRRWPREGGTSTRSSSTTRATLVYLAGQNAITLHVWLSRADRLDRPDHLVFDLDPTPSDFADVRRGGPRDRRRCCATSGSRRS